MNVRFPFLGLIIALALLTTTVCAHEILPIGKEILHMQGMQVVTEREVVSGGAHYESGAPQVGSQRAIRGVSRFESRAQSPPILTVPVGDGAIWVVAPENLQKNGCDQFGNPFQATSQSLEGILGATFQILGQGAIGFVGFYPQNEITYFPNENTARLTMDSIDTSMTLDEIQAKCDANMNLMVALSPDKSVLAAVCWGKTLAKQMPNGELLKDQNGDVMVFDTECIILKYANGKQDSMILTGIPGDRYIQVYPVEAQEVPYQ